MTALAHRGSGKRSRFAVPTIVRALMKE